MDTTQALLGVFMPLVLAVLNRHAWSSEAKGVVALAVCAVVAVLVMLVQGQDLALTSIFTATATVYGVAQATFHLAWQPTGAADALERRTG